MENKFFISTDSWHYNYYCWIRKLYLGQKDKPKVTSICPYFHTMLWGSLFAIVASPFLIVATVGLRALRFVLKFNNPVIDWIDTKTPVGMVAKDGRKAIHDAPVIGGFVTAVALMVVLTMLLGALAAVGCFFLFIPEICSSIGDFIVLLGLGALYVGWAIFWLLGHVAWCLEGAGYGIKYAAIAVAQFFASPTTWKAVFYCGLIIAVATFSSLAVWAATQIRCVNDFVNKFCVKRNGYETQHLEREERRRQKSANTKWDCPYCGGTNYADKTKCYHCGYRSHTSWIVKLGKYLGILAEKEFHFPRKPAWVNLGFFASIVVAVKAIKHRVCPKLEFVSPEELQNRVRAAVAQDHDVNEQDAKRLGEVWPGDVNAL